MKRLLIALLAVVAVTGTAPAADMPARMPVKAPPVVAPVFNWTGFYIGGFVGGARTSSVTTNDPKETISNGNLPVGFPYDCPAPGAPFFGAVCAASYNLKSSVIAGGTLGYNWQPAGSPWLLGIEGEAGYIKLTGAANDNFTAGLPCSLTGPFTLPPSQCNTFFSTTVGNWYGVIAGRAGMTWDRLLVYGKAGAAFARVQSSATDNCSVAPCGAGLLNATGDKTVVGWAAGAGLEYALTDNWSIKGEYLHLGIDTTSNACGVQSNPAVPASFNATFCSSTSVHGIDTAKLGVNYRFGAAAPVVARY